MLRQMRVTPYHQLMFPQFKPKSLSHDKTVAQHAAFCQFQIVFFHQNSLMFSVDTMNFAATRKMFMKHMLEYKETSDVLLQEFENLRAISHVSQFKKFVEAICALLKENNNTATRQSAEFQRQKMAELEAALNKALIKEAVVKQEMSKPALRTESKEAKLQAKPAGSAKELPLTVKKSLFKPEEPESKTSGLEIGVVIVEGLIALTMG